MNYHYCVWLIKILALLAFSGAYVRGAEPAGCVPQDTGLSNPDFPMFLRNFICEPSNWLTSAEAANVWSLSNAYKGPGSTVSEADSHKNAVDELIRLFRYVHDVNDQANCYPNCQIHVWQRGCNRLCRLLSPTGHCYVAELNLQRDNNASYSVLGSIYDECYALSMTNYPLIAGPFEYMCKKIMGSNDWGYAFVDDNDLSQGLKC